MMYSSWLIEFNFVKIKDSPHVKPGHSPLLDWVPGPDSAYLLSKWPTACIAPFPGTKACVGLCKRSTFQIEEYTTGTVPLKSRTWPPGNCLQRSCNCIAGGWWFRLGCLHVCSWGHTKWHLVPHLKEKAVSSRPLGRMLAGFSSMLVIKLRIFPFIPILPRGFFLSFFFFLRGFFCNC